MNAVKGETDAASMVGTFAATPNWTVAVLDRSFASVTFTENENKPASRGVPETVPFPDTVIPAGNPVAKKEYGAVPPAEVSRSL